MSDQLPLYSQMTCEDTPECICSPELESGTMSCNSPGGPQNAKSGQDRAPASPSARPAKAKRSTIRGTFGQSSFGSSEHEDLSCALVSKLRPLTDSLGSTLYKLTWITRVTPAGRSIPALRASGRRTKDNGCTGWPSPNAGPLNLTDTTWERRREALKDKHVNGNGFGLNLGMAATLAGWKTPTACSPNSLRGNGQEPADREAGGHAVNLQDQVRLVGWKTPCVPNGGRISGNKTNIGAHRDGTKAQIGLENEARLTAFPENPDALDVARILNLEPQLQSLVDSGVTQVGFLLDRNGWEIVPASGQLSASHSRWMMGLPEIWDEAAIAASRSLKAKKRASCDSKATGTGLSPRKRRCS